MSSLEKYSPEKLDVDQLVENVRYKLSPVEIFRRCGIDIENDARNRIFWNITNEKRILIDDQMYEFLGYSRETYSKKKFSLTKLLKKPHNSHIQYDEVCDERDVRKKYYVLSGTDFDCLLMQMRTQKAQELRQLFSIMKHIVVKIHEYELRYEQYQAKMLHSQNNVLLRSMDELKSLMNEREERAERERVKAEQERVKAEQERVKAEQERQRAEERSNLMLNQMRRNVDILNNVIAPRVVPLPISKNKNRRLGLFKTPVRNEWYLMRRQREGWRDAERRLTNRGYESVRVWDDISHAIDIGNEVKKLYRQNEWYARGNYLRSKQLEAVPCEHVADIIDKIVNKCNEANYLADENSIY